MSAADGGLPPLLGNGRTALLGGLVLSGAGLAVASAGVAHLISQLDRIPDTWGRILFVALLAVLVGVVASLRILERVLAEKLGQNYVQEIRLIVLRSALAGTRGPSLAITVARTTNDLNSVRNWMTYGVSALAVGIPLILALVVALWILSPVLAPTILLPMVLLSTLLGLLVGPAYRRSRALRKQRGRLAAQIGDSLSAALAIRAGGGEERELRRLEELGAKVSAAAVSRAAIAGALRAGAAAAASASAVAVAVVGTFAGLDHLTIAAGLTLVGLVAAPIHELGRCVEYRQSFRAARHVLGPVLAPVPALAAPAGAGPSKGGPGSDGGPGPLVEATAIRLPGDGEPFDLAARPGERILVTSVDPQRVVALFETFLGLRHDGAASVRINGREVVGLPSRDRRALIGYARRGLPVERGTIARAVRYRHPDLPESVVRRELELAGMRGLDALPRAEQTVLRRGGEPLSVSDRAKVHVARAMLKSPALLLMDHIDADLGPDGVAALIDRLASYPGVVIAATDAPERLRGNWSRLSLDEPNAKPVPLDQPLPRRRELRDGGLRPGVPQSRR